MGDRLKNLIYFPAVYLAQGIISDEFNSLRKLFGTTGAAGSQNAGQLIEATVNILLILAGSVAVIFLVIGGYQYVVARGNEEAAESAKKTMTSSIIGLVIIILAFAIIAIITDILLGSPDQVINE